MNELFIPFGNIFSLFRSKVKGLYNFGWDIVQGAAVFNSYQRDKEKLAMVLGNPAVLKVFALQCDLFSMGKVCVKDDEGNDVDEDPFLELLKKPNLLTLTESQFLWDFMFWNMMGTAYCYIDSKVVDRKENCMYFLDPSKIQWPQELERQRDKMIFSESEYKKLGKSIITYRYEDGTEFKFPLDRLVISYDLTNTTGNFFKGPSKLDALYKIISNSEHVLDAENINIRYTGKFMVGSDTSTGATNKLGMSETEKLDIISKIDTNEKNVYPVRSKVNIQRFVEDLAALQLPQEYLHQYFLIGNMYNIPRDVLEAYNSATYENQEKARAAHVNYTLDPKGNQFMDGFEIFFGYDKLSRNIVMTWDHLPFMQVFAKEKVEAQKVTVEVLNSLLALGMTLEDANVYLGTQFIIPENAKPEAETGQGSDQEGQGDQAETGQGAASNTEVDEAV